MADKRKIAKNLADVEYAVGQQRLEGLDVSDEAIQDLQRVARGEMTPEEYKRRVLERYGCAE